MFVTRGHATRLADYSRLTGKPEVSRTYSQFLVCRPSTKEWQKIVMENRSVWGKALLHIVNDSDVFLKDLMRLKGNVKTIGRNIKLAPGPRVKVVWTVEKRERASDLQKP